MSAGSLGSASYEFEVRMEGFIAGLNQAKAQAEGASGSIGSSFQQMGQRLQKAGQQLTLGVTAPIAGMAAGIIKAGSDFETAFTGIEKTVSATPEQFARINAEIREMATIMPVTREELARIGEVAGQLGVEQENIVAFSDTIARLGVTTNLVSDQAATQFARLFNVMGVGNDRIAEFGSVVVDLGNNFATTEAEILDTGSRLAPVLAQFGVGVGEVLAFSTALSSMNVQAEAGGTAMARLFIRIGEATTKGGEELERFAEVAGMSAEQFATAFEQDAARAVQAFIVGINDMNASGPEVIALMEELGLSEIRLRQATLALAGGSDTLTEAMRIQGTEFARTQALAQESERRFGTFASQIQILKNQLSDAGVELFQSLRPALMRFIEVAIQGAEVIGALAEAFAGLPPQVQSFVLGALAIAAAAGPAAIGIGLMVTALGGLAGPVGIAVAAVAVIGGLVVAFNSASEEMPDAVKRWETAVRNLNLSLEEFPEPPSELIGKWKDAAEEIDEETAKLRELHLSDFITMDAEELAADGEALERYTLLIDRVAAAMSQGAELTDAQREAVEKLNEEGFIVTGDDIKNLEAAQRLLLDITGIDWANIPGIQDLQIREVQLDKQALVGEINAAIDEAAQAAEAPFIGPIFSDADIDIQRMREQFAEVPELAADALSNTILAVDAGRFDHEDAWRLYADVPSEIMGPAVQAYADEVRGKIVDATLGGEDISLLEGQLRLVEELFGEFLGGSEEKFTRVSDTIQTGVTGWATAQGILDEAIRSSSSAISKWESDSKDIETAMEILQRHYDEGRIGIDEYTEGMDFFNDSNRRVEDGIKGQEEAFVTAVRNREELRRVIDETSAAIEEELAKNDDSAEGQERLRLLTEGRDRAQRDFTAALIGSEDPQERMIGHQQELADAFGTVVGELRGLLEDLGILDDTSAEPKIEVDAVASEEKIQEMEENVTDFPDGPEIVFTLPNIQDTALDMQGMEENVENFPQPAETVFVSNDTGVMESLSRIGEGFDTYEARELPPKPVDVEIDDALTDLNILDGELNAFEGGSYSVTVDANIAPALNKLTVLGQNLPESPAKEGPLAFTPDWDWLFEGLEAAAEQYTSESLEHLQAFVSLASQAIDLLSSAGQLGGEIGDVAIGNFPSRDKLEALANFMEQVVGVVLDEFVGSDELPEYVSDWVSFTQSALSLIDSVVETATNLESLGNRLPGDYQREQITALKFFVEHLVKSLGDTAAALIEGRGTAFLPQMEHLSTASLAALELVTKAVEAVTALSRLGTEITGTHYEQVSAIKFFTEHLVLSLGDTAALIASTRDGDFIPQMQAFSLAAQDGLDLVILALDALRAISEIGDRRISGVDFEWVTDIKFFVEHLVGSFGDSAVFLESMRDNDSFLESATEFSEVVSGAVEALRLTLEFFQDLASITDQISDDMDLVRGRIIILAELARFIAENFDAAASEFQGSKDRIADFAEAVGTSVGALADVLGFMETLVNGLEFLVLSSDEVDAYSAALSGVALLIAENFDAAASHWEETKEGGVAALATAVSESIGALTSVLEFHEALAGGLEAITLSSDDIDVYSAALAGDALNIAQNFDAVAEHWEETRDGGVSDFAQAVTDTTGALGEVLSFLGALSELTDSAWRDSLDVEAAASRLSDIALILAEAFAASADDWEADVNPAMTDFAEAVSDSAGALGDVISFLGALKDLSEKEGSDNFGPELTARLVAIATQVAEAVRNAAEGWGIEADPEIAAFSADVSASAGALQSVVSLLKSLSVDEDEKPIKFSAASLSPVFSGLRYIVGQFRSISDQVSGEGVESVVAIIDALGAIRSLFDRSPQQARDVEDAVRDWSELVQDAFAIIDAISSQMDGVLDDAEHYRDTAIAVADAIMTGNMALAGIEGLDIEGSVNGSMGDLSMTGNGNFSDLSNSIPVGSAQTAPASGPFVVNNSLDTLVFEQLVVDQNSEMTKKVFG